MQQLILKIFIAAFLFKFFFKIAGLERVLEVNCKMCFMFSVISES